MANKTKTRVWASTPRRLDELCPVCFLPDMWVIYGYKVIGKGEPQEVESITWCDDEDCPHVITESI